MTANAPLTNWNGNGLTSPDAERRLITQRLLEIDRETWRRECQNSLGAWCIEALSPAEQRPAPHHWLLIRHLDMIARGKIDRLMVLMPPGSAKSTYASVLFPPWWFGRHPDGTVIAASHTAELAERFGRRVRNLVASSGGVFDYHLSPDNKAAGRWETTRGGEYFAAGVSGSITGRRADLAIIDDPVASKEDAESETVRQRTWDWYRNDLYTRMKPGGAIVLIMTRWHEDDLGGRLLAEAENGGDQWRVLKLPALATDADDPLGRAANEPLWPEWENVEAIARKRATLGERDFGALFQQDPRPAGTSFFDVEKVLVDGEPVDPPRLCDAVFCTIDTAVKTGSKNDSTAVTYWAMSKHLGHKLTVLDWDVISIEGSLLETWLPVVFQNLEALALTHKARRGSIGAFIEDKSSGMVLLQHAARRGWNAHPIDSKLTSVGKDERAISVSGYVARGDVKMSRHAYEKVTTHKGRSGNHFMMQVFRFQIGVKDQADDALDTFCYGIAIALGDSNGF
jgi:hypothetical protein